jgi:hypothetical protein
MTGREYRKMQGKLIYENWYNKDEMNVFSETIGRRVQAAVPRP